MAADHDDGPYYRLKQALELSDVGVSSRNALSGIPGSHLIQHTGNQNLCPQNRLQPLMIQVKSWSSKGLHLMATSASFLSSFADTISKMLDIYFSCFCFCKYKQNFFLDKQVKVLSDIFWRSCNCDINLKQDSSQSLWLVTSHTKTYSLLHKGAS